MAKINPGKIKAVMFTVVMAMALFAILPTIVPDLVEDVYNYSAEMALLTTELGTAPAAFFTTLNTLTGWFWVIGSFGLIIAVVTSVLALRSRGRGRRRR